MVEGPLEGMFFVQAPPGTVLMGSDIVDAARFDEAPSTEVSIEPFEIMTTEVTQGMWTELMDRDADPLPYLWTDLCGRGTDYPVYAVSWFDCREFIDRMNELDPDYVYRLPGEAEWQYACMAGSDTYFYWNDVAGDDRAADFCRYRGDEDRTSGAFTTGEGTLEVASLEPNHWGLYDMSGNVSEWCYDRYSPDYDYLPDDGSPFIYPCDDQWPDQMNTRRVHRGGSWLTDLDRCRSSSRGSQPSEQWAVCIGFRLVREPRTDESAAAGLFREGLELIDADSTAEGISRFGEALALDPLLLNAWILGGFHRHGIGETDQAISDLRRAIELDPTDVGAWQMLGVVLSDAGHDQQALKMLDRVVELDPCYPLVYFHRGIAHGMLWNVQEALDDLALAAVFDPGAPRTYYARACILFLDGCLEEAVEDLGMVLERDPDHADAFMLRSQAYRELGELERAEADSLRAAALGVTGFW